MTLLVCIFIAVATQALQMPYFYNKPCPTPGPQLPRSGVPAEVLKEQPQPRAGQKRKLKEESGMILLIIDHLVCVV